MAVLSPKFEVRPQSGGRWPRTFEPGRLRPLYPRPGEFESRPRLSGPVPGAPARFKKQSLERPGSILLSRQGFSRASLGGSHHAGPSGCSCCGEGRRGGSRAGSSWVPVVSCSQEACGLLGGGTRWTRTPVARAGWAVGCLGFISAKPPGPLSCPVSPQMVPVFVSGHGHIQLLRNGAQDPLLTLELKSRWTLGTSHTHAGGTAV